MNETSGQQLQGAFLVLIPIWWQFLQILSPSTNVHCALTGI